MSIRASNWAWETGRELGLNQGELLVLIRVADHADNDGRCWPGTAGIADYTCMEERSVRRILTRLEESDLLHRERRESKHGRGRANNAICLHLDLPDIESGRSEATNRTSASARSEPINRTLDAPSTGQPGPRHIQKNHQGTVAPVDQRSTGATAQSQVPDSVSSLLPHLNRVGERKGAKVLNLDAVVRACEKFGDRDLDLEAERFEHYWLEGVGENRPMRDVAASWRNWLQTAPRMSKRGQIRAAERRQARDHRKTDPGKRAFDEQIKRAREAAA